MYIVYHHFLSFKRDTVSVYILELFKLIFMSCFTNLHFSFSVTSDNVLHSCEDQLVVIDSML